MAVTQMNPRKKAFTLIELLVVISIIALLLSVLLPALSTAKEQAKRVLCGSQLRQAGIAFQMYKSSNKDWLPHNVNYSGVNLKPFWQPHFFGNYAFPDWENGGTKKVSYAAVMASYIPDPIAFQCPSADNYRDYKSSKYAKSHPGSFPYKAPPVQYSNGEITSNVMYPWDYLAYNYSVGWLGYQQPTLNGVKCKVTRAQARNGKVGVLLVDKIFEYSLDTAVTQHSGRWDNHKNVGSRGPGGNRLMTDGSCRWIPWRAGEMAEMRGGNPFGWIYW